MFIINQSMLTAQSSMQNCALIGRSVELLNYCALIGHCHLNVVDHCHCVFFFWDSSYCQPYSIFRWSNSRMSSYNIYLYEPINVLVKNEE